MPISKENKHKNNCPPSTMIALPKLKNAAHLGKCFNILVVDDDPISRQAIYSILSPLKNYSIQFAANGIDAVELFLGNNFNLVLVDMLLPDISGLEVAVGIRSFANDKNTPIIAFSSYVCLSEEYTLAGINDFLLKPLEAKVLEKIVNHWLATSCQ